MAIYKATNNGMSLLAAALTPTSTSLQVLSGHGARFPLIGANEYTRVTIQDTANRKEIVEVTQRLDGADTMTVVRGREGTIPLEWAAGALVECRPTVGVVATVDGAQALQNKIIDGSKNTLLNVGVKELLSGVVGVDNFMGTLTGITAYVPGQRFWFTVPEPNTGPCTLSVNGMLALPLVKDRGRALQAGDLRAGDLVCAYCDGSRFWMIYGGNGLTGAVTEALGLKAPLESPVFTGTVKVPLASDPASPVRKAEFDSTLLQTLEQYAFEVGDYKFTSKLSLPPGRRWLLCDGRTIGSSTSGATSLASVEAQALFLHLWETYDNTICPIYSSTGAPTSRGASALADWTANKRLGLLDWRGLYPRVHHHGSNTFQPDTSAGIGSYLADQNKAHVHKFQLYGGVEGRHPEKPAHSFYPTAANLVDTQSSGGDESRPKTRTLNMFIRY